MVESGHREGPGAHGQPGVCEVTFGRRDIMERQQWKEKDFERWFLANPILPEDESMLVIARERSICRVADIVALDKLGRIWVMEIKNEKSTRSALGQAMEYLAQFDEIEPEGLADEFANLASGDLTREQG
jgi:RecB family endonuclease NucS